MRRNRMRTCKDCVEWEFFEGYGWGCYLKKISKMPINADECDGFSLDPTKEILEQIGEKQNERRRKNVVDPTK
jgi:hypothetical protein